MQNIFLKSVAIRESLVPPQISEILNESDLVSMVEYIRGLNFINLRNGDSKLCRKINGEVCKWINQNTSSKASLWICAPYPNLRNKETPMEHVIGVVESRGKRFLFDGTAGQTTITSSNVIVVSVDSIILQEVSLTEIFGGINWKSF